MGTPQSTSCARPRLDGVLPLSPVQVRCQVMMGSGRGRGLGWRVVAPPPPCPDWIGFSPHSRSGPQVRTRGWQDRRVGVPASGKDEVAPLPLPPGDSSIASTCYAIGGMPLAFPQEDFLVIKLQRHITQIAWITKRASNRDYVDACGIQKQIDSP